MALEPPTSTLRAALVAMRSQGLSLKAIGGMHSITRGQVSKRLSGRGGEAGRDGMSSDSDTPVTNAISSAEKEARLFFVDRQGLRFVFNRNLVPVENEQGANQFQVDIGST